MKTENGHVTPRTDRAVITWLILVCLNIVAVVAVGGVTRLTESGLSMVDWRPLMGVVPPHTEAEWQVRFEQYQAFPEYQLRNSDMDLPGFQRIFLWEYTHRMLARGVGFIFLLPFLYFVARHRVRGRLVAKLVLVFVLGGLQGLLGWYMVQSGLVSNPFVSHYRLAAHLSLALAVLVYVVWIILDQTQGRESRDMAARRRLGPWAVGFWILIAIQIVYGAFVAGLDAGYMLNTYPKMLGRWLPPGLFVLDPWWRNLLDNPTAVQFVHRWLGTAIGLVAIALWTRTLSLPVSTRERRSIHVVVSLTLLQVVVGILTLLLVVPIPVAVLHQVLACLVLVAATWAVHATFRGRESA